MNFLIGLATLAAALAGVALFLWLPWPALLAILVALGIVLVAVGRLDVGATLVLAGAGSMASAALVLFVTSPSNRGAALKQGLLPALGVLAVILALAL